MGFVHDVGTRDRFYELVCVEGVSLTAAVEAVGAGMGSSTRWWRQAFGMDVEIAKGKVGGPKVGPVTDVAPGRFLTLGFAFKLYPGAFVLKRATAWNQFNAAPEPVRKGAKITIKGQLTRADWDQRAQVGYSGRVVAVEFRTKTGTYREIKTVKTGSGGHLTTTVTASADGYWRLRYGGNSTAGASTVAGDFVDVK